MATPFAPQLDYYLPDSVSLPQMTGQKNECITQRLLFRDAIPTRWVLAFGAAVGLALHATVQFLSSFQAFEIVPFKYTAHVIVASIVVFYPARAMLTYRGWLKNHRLDRVELGTTVAKIPGSMPGIGNPEFCLVLLTARSNSPLGLFDPDFKWVGDSYTEMVKDLQLRRQETGLLNIETLLSCQSETNNTLFSLIYFESTKHVVQWARTGLHRSAWMKVAKNPEKYQNIELTHEVMTVKEGSFESLYLNTERRGAGDLYEFIPNSTPNAHQDEKQQEPHVKQGGGEGVGGEGLWRSTLKRGPMKVSPKGRMDWAL